METKQILKSIIHRFNNNPMNPMKLYFTFTETVEEDKKTSFEIRFGCSEKNSFTVKSYLSEKADKKESEERLYSDVLSYILYNLYKRIDNDTFIDNSWSKIIRVENE